MILILLIIIIFKSKSLDIQTDCPFHTLATKQLLTIYHVKSKRFILLSPRKLWTLAKLIKLPFIFGATTELKSLLCLRNSS